VEPNAKTVIAVIPSEARNLALQIVIAVLPSRRLTDRNLTLETKGDSSLRSE